MKIFASNFTNRLTTGAQSKKCKITSSGVVKGSRGLLLKFWDPLHISGTVEARNFKFGRQIDHKEYSPKMLSSDHHCGFMGGLATLYYKC